MPLYKAPLQAVVDSINRLNKLDLVAEEYTFSTPQALATPRGQINTEIEITAKDQWSAYSGSVVVGYRRLPLSELSAQVNLVVPLTAANTTLDIALALNKYFSTVFTADDIIVRDLTEEEKTIPSTILLEANPTSYGWIGSVEVGTRVGGYHLPTYLTVRSLSGMNYPTPVSTRPYAHIYSYWRDFSEQYELLKDVAPGTEDLEKVRQALQAGTLDTWVLEGSGRYTLDGASILEVAEPRLRPEDYNDDYDLAILVQLDDSKSLGLTGKLTLHFNIPIDI